MATFNVRISNTINQLIRSEAEHYMNITNNGNEWTFVSTSAWKNSVNAAIECVRMPLSPRAI